MQYDKNQKIQNFVWDYLQLCRKHNLCIGTTLEGHDTDILRLYTLSDYDFSQDEDGKPIPIYYDWFIRAIEENYDEEYFKKMLK